MTEEDLKRINRIFAEATGDPLNKVIPKRIYPDDALFTIEMIWTLLKKIERLERVNAKQKQ